MPPSEKLVPVLHHLEKSMDKGGGKRCGFGGCGRWAQKVGRSSSKECQLAAIIYVREKATNKKKTKKKRTDTPRRHREKERRDNLT